MGSYKIEWKKSAIRELYRIRRDYIPKIIEAVETLVSNPFPSGVKKLSGSERTYRLRVGNYRIIYEVERDKLVIHVLRVRHRKQAYR